MERPERWEPLKLNLTELKKKKYSYNRSLSVAFTIIIIIIIITTATALPSVLSFILIFQVSYNRSDLQGNFQIEWGKQEDAKAITNVFLMKRNDKLFDAQYNLHTPYYKEDTVLAKLISLKRNDYFDVKAHLFSPKSRLLSFGEIRFADIYNMNGTVNTTTPFPQLTYAGADFDILTQKFVYFLFFF